MHLYVFSHICTCSLTSVVKGHCFPDFLANSCRWSASWGANISAVPSEPWKASGAMSDSKELKADPLAKRSLESVFLSPKTWQKKTSNSWVFMTHPLMFTPFQFGKAPAFKAAREIWIKPWQAEVLEPRPFESENQLFGFNSFLMEKLRDWCWDFKQIIHSHSTIIEYNRISSHPIRYPFEYTCWKILHLINHLWSENRKANRRTLKTQTTKQST